MSDHRGYGFEGEDDTVAAARTESLRQGVYGLNEGLKAQEGLAEVERLRAKKLSATRQQLVFSGVGIEAVVTDLHKAVGEDVLEEACDKGESGQCHQATASVLRVILVGEGAGLLDRID